MDTPMKHLKFFMTTAQKANDPIIGYGIALLKLAIATILYY